MGMHMTVLIGSYLTVANQKEQIPTEITVHGCKEHGKHDQEFCGKCGSKKTSWKETVYESKDATDILWDKLEDEDTFWTPESHHNEHD
jgi:rRNA maturation endonuclease Nob1